MSFLGNVKLKEVYIKNHHADTLIYIENLTTSIVSFKKLVDGKPEFGQIFLDNFILNIKTYKGEVDDALTVFVDKFDDGTVSDQPSGFLLTSTRLKLNNGYVEVVDANIKNDQPIFFKKIKGSAKNFKIEGPNVTADIKNLHFIENRNIEVENLTSNFSYSKISMSFNNTLLETAESSLEADIIFNYHRDDFSDFNNKVKLNADVQKANLSLIDLKKFYNELGTDDELHFSTKITGTLNNFITHNLDLESDKGAIIKGTINFKNVFNQENGFSLEGDIDNLTSDYYHLKALLPNVLGNTLPTEFSKLGKFTLKGKTFITPNLIDAKLVMNSNLGSVISDLELTNVTNIDDATYIGHIEFIDFQLGKLIDNPSIGLLSTSLDVDGEGFSLEKMNTSVKGIITNYEYNKYAYKNIKINGVVKKKHFNGETEVNDENIKLNFNGLADFSSKIYTFNFKAVVDYCDLNTINLFKRDSISNLKGEININVKGNSIDDLVGNLDFKDMLYTNQKGDYFFKDFNINSSFEDSTRTITINSPEIITGRIKGKFKFAELGHLAQNSIGSIYSNYKPYKVTSGQYLDFRFNVYNKIVEVFYPEIVLDANSSVRGNISADDNLFKLNIKSPRVEAYKTIIEDLNVQIDNKNPLFNTQLSIDKIKSEYYSVSNLKLVNITLNDTLYFRTEFDGGEQNTEQYNLAFYHTFNKENKSVFGMQKSNFTFKNNKWVINPEDNFKNKVVFDSKRKTYDISQFLIASNNEEIEIYGTMKDTISKDLNFKFKNVKLSSITPEIDSLKLKGIVNGTLNYKQITDKIKPTADLTIANFYVNNSYQGDLKVNIEGKNSVKNYLVDISLKRNGNINFSALGDLDFTPKEPTLDLIVDFEEFKLDAFSPLGEDVFTNIRGFVYGNVNLTGLVKNPDMTGTLFLDKAGMYFPYLNVDYEFDGTSIVELTNQTFTFDDVTIKDSFKNTKGKITGTIKHSHFDNWKLDLSVNTKNLLVLNTIEKENSLYFGTGFLEGNAFIKGPTDKLVIDVVGKTKKGTHFIIPISDVKTVESSQLIRFISKDNSDNNEEIRRQFISDKLKGLSMVFNLEITKDAIVEMVLDKATGSYIKGSGTGNLQIDLDTKDKFDMYGDFIVDNGVYNFKYGGFINKPFAVRKGGSISWSGNPFTADINIEAVYRVSANPKSLLENIVANRKIPIDLITRFSGELFNSQRDFDIEIPNSSSTVASELEFKLNSNDENNKTVHFISLLVSGSFYNESDLSVNSNAALYGTSFDMLSNVFDNILNQGNNRFKLKPVYTVGEKYKVDNLNIDDQLAIALDYQLNDKIIINGKVGMPIGSKDQTNVIGEVNVEFLMNDEGTFRSSIFNRQNEIQYTEEEEGYTQGAGLTYQIDFDSGKELLEKLKLKKKKPIDSIPEKQSKDSIITENKIIKFKNKSIKK
ncbi:translocation/assembly module TamB domain-containing protein [Lutibacter sp.]|uniref:translocation/assembly module TamB domain-containing protein n=1 Tax=Lutibacter sp. TaxID=1925666 RepID=UPI001A1F52D6|nr:translocation/assembly module TamB [Lutibacter sp.]MBI9041752.1 translocation/assembly module TamB [Lutibacter sp.]